jgi:hypothetical protein
VEPEGGFREGRAQPGRDPGGFKDAAFDLICAVETSRTVFDRAKTSPNVTGGAPLVLGYSCSGASAA